VKTESDFVTVSVSEVEVKGDTLVLTLPEKPGDKFKRKIPLPSSECLKALNAGTHWLVTMTKGFAEAHHLSPKE
jgi:hypothetical protein